MLYGVIRLAAALMIVFLAVTDASARKERPAAWKRVDSLNIGADRNQYRPDSLIFYARKAYDLAVTSDYDIGKGVALRFMGIYEYNLSNFDSAITLYERALDLFRKEGYEPGMANAMHGLATVHNNLNNHIESIQYGLKALAILEKDKQWVGVGSTLNLIGVSWAKQGEFHKAMEYFRKYNQLVMTGTDTVNIAHSFNNLGAVYRDLGSLDSALRYFNRGFELFRTIRHLPGLSTSYRNIGGIYHDRGDYTTALHYAYMGLDVNMQTGEKRAQSHSLHDIGSIHLRLSRHDSARPFFLKALEIAAEIGEKEVLRNSSFQMAMLNEQQGDIAEAFRYFKQGKAYADSMLDQEKVMVYGDLEKKYQTERKQRQIETLSHEMEVNRLKLHQRGIMLVAISLVLSSAALTVYLVQNRRKLKARAAYQTALRQQQQDAARDVLDAEENERRRIAADLHDGVGQLLSAALLTLSRARTGQDEQDSAGIITERAFSLLDESYREVRSISHRMLPGALLHSGLGSAVRELLDKLRGGKLNINLDVVGLDDRLDEHTETVLYRVIQETVNNVIRHSDASSLSIQIVQDEEGISVAIEDNGKGFDPAEPGFSGGMGMRNIRSRVAILNGTLEIDSAPGKGTSIMVQVPASPPENSSDKP